MKGLKKKRRVQVIAITGLSLAVCFGIFFFLVPEDAINFFRSPTEVAQSPPGPNEVFRIGGVVEEGSLIRDEGETISFRVTDFSNSIPVTYTGVLPDLFGEGEGMVGTGRYVNGVFEVQPKGLLARHDETYVPAELEDALPPEVIEDLRTQGG